MSTRPNAFETLEPRVLFSAKPTLAAIPNQTLLAGSPLHIGLDGFDRDSKKLRYVVSSSDPRLSATVFTGERSLALDVKNYGTMKFYLFDRRAGRATGRITKLAQSGFYNGVTFHRVINNFVIQAGDPTGTGSGGSTLGDFDDQFHPDLQHNTTGILSMAKGGDDTNDSQFFITEGPQRSLDFNHTIFGLLVEGESVREAISNVPVGANDKPNQNVVITRARVLKDQQNGVLMLKAPEGYTGNATVSVTAIDETGKRVTRTFTVNIQADTVDGNAYLNAIPPVVGVAGQSNTFQLSATNVEGDSVFFDGVVSNTTPPAGFSFDVNNNTGLATFTAPAGYSGPIDVLVGVRDQSGANTVDTWDTQVVTLNIVPPDAAGDTLATARNLGTLGNRLPQGTILDVVGGSDKVDLYKLRIKKTTAVTFRLANLSANTDLEVIDARGRVIARSAKPGLSAEKIRGVARKGTYYLRVSTDSATNAGYTLSAKGVTARSRAASSTAASAFAAASPALAAWWDADRRKD